MKTKAAKLFSCCKYELIIFAVLLIQAVSNLFTFGGVGEYTSIYYLSDYSIGINTRLLVGSIVGLINDSPTIEWITGFAIVVLVLTLLAVAFLTGKVIRNTDDEMRPQLYVIIAFMLSGSFTFSFFSIFLGSLDIYTFIVAMIAVVCSLSKKTRWLVPILCVVGVLTHNIFAVSYFPMVFLVLFYLLLKEDSKVYSAAVLLVSLVATVAITVNFMLYAGKNMNISFEEFCKIINEKSSIKIDEYGFYGIGFHLFSIVGDDVVEGFTIGEQFNLTLVELIKGLVQYISYSMSLENALPILVVYVLIYGALIFIWAKCAKNSETKMKKLSYIAFMLAPLTALIGFVVTTDYVRWVQAAVLSQFAFALVMYIKKDEAFLKTMQQMREYFGNKKLILVVIYIIYAFTTKRTIV